jgi:hypothetical protein
LSALGYAIADTAGYRTLVLFLDTAILWTITGSMWKATGAAFVMFAMKTVVYFLWRWWRETLREETA